MEIASIQIHPSRGSLRPQALEDGSATDTTWENRGRRAAPIFFAAVSSGAVRPRLDVFALRWCPTVVM